MWNPVGTHILGLIRNYSFLKKKQNFTKFETFYLKMPLCYIIFSFYLININSYYLIFY